MKHHQLVGPLVRLLVGRDESSKLRGEKRVSGESEGTEFEEGENVQEG